MTQDYWESEDKNIQLYCADCLEVMKDVPDNSINAIITDPPYNISVHNSKINRGVGSSFDGGDIILDFGEWDKDVIRWEDFIDLFVRVLMDNGVLAMFYEKLLIGVIGKYLSEQHGCKIRHVGAYIKSNPAPQARKVQWMNGMELFLLATKNSGAGHHFNWELGQSTDYFKRSVNYKRLHPTQKPLDLMEWIIRYWSYKDDMILDPFMGSGTTGVACVQTGRRFIGIEINKEYYNISKERIQEAQLQIRMNI